MKGPACAEELHKKGWLSDRIITLGMARDCLELLLDFHGGGFRLGMVRFVGHPERACLCHPQRTSETTEFKGAPVIGGYYVIIPDRAFRHGHKIPAADLEGTVCRIFPSAVFPTGPTSPGAHSQLWLQNTAAESGGRFSSSPRFRRNSWVGDGKRSHNQRTNCTAFRRAGR